MRYTPLEQEVLKVVTEESSHSTIQELAFLLRTTPQAIGRAVSRLSAQGRVYRYGNEVWPFEDQQ